MEAIFQKTISIFCVLVLFMSFGLHSLQVKHVHYSEANSHEHSASGHSESHDGIESLATKMHMAEKKLTWFALSATLLFFAFVQIPQLAFMRIEQSLFVSLQSRKRKLLHIVYSHIRQLFTCGILNPKLY